MGLLTKAQILAADKKKTEDVVVKEWGGSVRRQELSAADRDLWESESFITETDDEGEQSARFNPKQARARLVVRCLVGDDPDRADVSCADQGVLGALTGVLGSLAAIEAIRAIVPFGADPAGTLLMIDTLDFRFRTVRLPKDPGCRCARDRCRSRRHGRRSTAARCSCRRASPTRSSRARAGTRP